LAKPQSYPIYNRKPNRRKKKQHLHIIGGKKRGWGGGGVGKTTSDKYVSMHMH